MGLLTRLLVEQQLPGLVSSLFFGCAQTLRSPHPLFYPTLESCALLLKERAPWQEVVGVNGLGCGRGVICLCLKLTAFLKPVSFPHLALISRL